MEVRKARVSCQYIVETNIIINKAHVALSNLKKNVPISFRALEPWGCKGWTHV